MSTLDTIAAIATAPGAGGVAIVRISGVDAYTVAAAVFRRRGGHGLPTDRRVYFGTVIDSNAGAVLDEVLAFGMRAPRSYTGEDVVEIQCHGGTIVSQTILQCVCRAGARPAEPGEFTKRAFLNGRLDLAQAEAVADLVSARSEEAVRLAWSQLDGTLSMRVSTLRSSIVRARALCEVVLDFPEEDIPDSQMEDVGFELARVRVELEKLAATFQRGHLRYGGAQVALIGRPNVGKSSLLNALVGRDRALVSSIPGTTRDVVEASVTIDGSPIILLDTAGIRETSDVVEAMGVDRSRSAMVQAACTLAVFDGSAALDPDDEIVRSAVAGRRMIAVLNKADLPMRVTNEAVRRLLGEVPVVRVSALHQDGLEALVAAIARAIFGGTEDSPDNEASIYRVRHYEAVRAAVTDVARAELALKDGEPLELVASDLAAASAALGVITGEITSEDVLDRVFADFCLGK
jgi:tRNA modification GTPase